MSAASASAAVPGVATYSYKPASGGLEGASTVVPLKAGGFLEVRRGEKTHWATGEVRQTWPTLDAWKASLPAGAIVQEKPRTASSRGVVKGGAFSPDFMTALTVYHQLTSRDPRSVTITTETNVSQAAHWEAEAACAVGERSKKFKEFAARALAKPAFEWNYCKRYNWGGAKKHVLYAQRISDGEFIPLYFDKRRGLLHSPSEEVFRHVGVMGDTFAALGVRPVFMAPVSRQTGRLRMVSLEKTAGAE